RSIKMTDARGTVTTISPGADDSFVVQRLAAGTYVFEITGENGNPTPSYAFRVQDLQALVIDHGSDVAFAGSVEPGKSLSVHRMELVAGQDYTLRFTSPTTSYALRYALVDAAGRIVKDNVNQSVASFQAADDGVLYLVVKRYEAAASIESFSVAVNQTVTRTEPLAMGELVQGSFSTANDWTAYSFQLSEPGWITLSDVGLSNSASQLVVLDAAGNALTTATRSWPTANGGAVMYLPAGEYRIRVWSKTNADASYQFRLVEGRTDADDALAKATDLRLPAGEAMVLDVTLGDGANGVADQDHYRLMLAEGQMLTASALTAGAAALTLLDATGQALATDDNGSLQFVASATGVYHLRVTPQ